MAGTSNQKPYGDHVPHFSTLALHADDEFEDCPDIAPPIHLSSTFKYTKDVTQHNDFEYSRLDTPTRKRAELVLARLEAGEKGYALLYGSGLAAIHAVVTHYRPKRVACRDGYFGSINVFRQRDLEMIDLDDQLQAGDLVWVETPRNATCDVYDIAHYCERAHKAGAVVAVDSSFAPPPLQYPLDHGADYVMHSTTKFLGGHSDMLGGAVVLNNQTWYHEMLEQREYLGNCPGSLECWLLLRSLRTLPLRVKQQCATAGKLAIALQGHPLVTTVLHPSLPTHPGHEVAKRQMKDGFGGVLAIEVESEELAVALPSKTHYFRPATSLGGVESLIDYRNRWDKGASKKLLRLSVGLEAYEDLLYDITRALEECKELAGKA